jgi:hypothetical protein
MKKSRLKQSRINSEKFHLMIRPEMSTKQRRQNRLSKESKAALRLFSRDMPLSDTESIESLTFWSLLYFSASILQRSYNIKLSKPQETILNNLKVIEARNAGSSSKHKVVDINSLILPGFLKCQLQ